MEFQVGGDRRVRGAVGCGQDDPGSHHVTVGAARRTGPGSQDRPILIGQDDHKGGTDHGDPFDPSGVLAWRSHAGPRWARMGTMAKIPDSTKSSVDQRLNQRARERWPQIRRIDTRFRAGFVSVSYTHLRAHETGRNLVCRLLLEKKKK